ncbi:hypothetical protein ZWY2020_038316 [Hordeum vulgare]|nr:hypothetical protein ZWY2020_038316 [Hordeum vulgare]
MAVKALLLRLAGMRGITRANAGLCAQMQLDVVRMTRSASAESVNQVVSDESSEHAQSALSSASFQYFVLDWLDLGRHNLHSNLAARIAAYTHDQVLKLVKLLKKNPSAYRTRPEGYMRTMELLWHPMTSSNITLDDVEEVDCFSSHISMNVQNAILPQQLGIESEYDVAGIDSAVELTPLATTRNMSPGLRRSGRLNAADKGTALSGSGCESRDRGRREVGHEITTHAGIAENFQASGDGNHMNKILDEIDKMHDITPGGLTRNVETTGSDGNDAEYEHAVAIDEEHAMQLHAQMTRESSRSMLAPRVLVYAIDSDSHDDPAFEEFSVNEHDRLVEIDRRLREQEARDEELAQKIEEESKRETDYKLEKYEELARKCQQELEDKAKDQVMRDSRLVDMYQKLYDGKEVVVQISLNDFFPLHTAICTAPVQGGRHRRGIGRTTLNSKKKTRRQVGARERRVRFSMLWRQSAPPNDMQPSTAAAATGMLRVMKTMEGLLNGEHLMNNYDSPDYDFLESMMDEQKLGYKIQWAKKFELDYVKKHFAYEVISMKGNHGEFSSFMIEEVLS